jgi:hypothetical protein
MQNMLSRTMRAQRLPKSADGGDPDESTVPEEGFKRTTVGPWVPLNVSQRVLRPSNLKFAGER